MDLPPLLAVSRWAPSGGSEARLRKKATKSAERVAGPDVASGMASPQMTSLEPYQEIAQTIAEDETPAWLAEHLRRWAPSIFVGRAVEKRQPSRSEMRRCLVKIKDAASLLQRALAEPATREFLEADPFQAIENIGGLDWVLKDLADRADRASRSPALTTKTGKTRAGRGSATPTGAYSAQTYCALLVAEIWKYFRGNYPAPRNRQAAQAADGLWRAAGGERNGWGDDPLNAWRRHFICARAVDDDNMRAEIQRHLDEARRHSKLLSP